MTPTKNDFDYSKLADDTYENCIVYRKLENKYMRGMEYTYSISDESVSILEDADPTGKELEKYCTNLKEVEAFDKIIEKERDEHMAKCEICLPYWEAIKVARSEFDA